MVSKIKISGSTKAVKRAKRQIGGYRHRYGRTPTGIAPKIYHDLPDAHNPVIIRAITRAELATIPRDRFDVKVIKVMVPLSKTDEVGGEEELMVAITNTDIVGTQKKQIAMKKNIGQKLALYPTPATVVWAFKLCQKPPSYAIRIVSYYPSLDMNFSRSTMNLRCVPSPNSVSPE